MKNYGNIKAEIEGLFIVITFILLTVHDYLFNSLLFDTPLYYLAGWKDFIVLAFLFYLLISIMYSSILFGKISRKDYLFFKLLILFILIALVGLISGTLNNLSNYRFYFLITFFSGTFSFVLSNNINTNSKYFELGLILSTLLIVFYGYFQYVTISIPNDFWYWDHFIDLGFDPNFWDVFREGRPRISSFFTSSLDYSLYLLVTFSILLSFAHLNYQEKKFLKFFFYLTFLIVVFHSIYLSTVRSALIGSVGVLFLFLVYLACRNTKTLVFFSILIFLGLSTSTFLYIILGFTDELSALGRIPQWINFLQLIKEHWIIGLGIANIGPKGEYWFDSFWINYFLSFGIVLGFVIVAIFIKLYFIVIKKLSFRSDKLVIIFYLPIYIITPIFFYLFFFQSFTRTPAIYLFVILFYVVSYLENRQVYLQDKIKIK